jgi:hypothetical protein
VAPISCSPSCDLAEQHSFLVPWLLSDRSPNTISPEGWHYLSPTIRLISRKLHSRPLFRCLRSPNPAGQANILLPQELIVIPGPPATSFGHIMYICTTCDNGKTNVFRNSGYPRGFVTWDDSIGIHPANPRCYCGLPSRQDRKCGKARAKSVGDGTLE